MKKFLFIIAAAATCMLVACSKEKELRTPDEITNEEETQQPGMTYISATIAENDDQVEGSKAHVNNDTGRFTWRSGDQIAVYSGDTYHLSEYLKFQAPDTMFVFYGSINAGRADFAVYPASLVHDGTNVREGSASNHTSTSLKLTLPDSYTYSQVSGNYSVIPMIATNAPSGRLEFKSICALLRITVQNVPKDAVMLKVTFPGKKVNGEYTLSNFTPGGEKTNGLMVEASTNEAEETITITDLGVTAFTSLTINVPVPIGRVTDTDYPYVRVAAYDSYDSGTEVYSHKINSIDTPIVAVSSEPKVWNPNRLTARKVTVKLPYFTTNSKTNQKVVFAPGNLRAKIKVKPASTSSPIGEAEGWEFAKHQYDALGDCDGNILKNVGDSLDLFAWIGKGATQTYELNQYGMLYPDAGTAYAGNQNPDTLKYSWGEIFNGHSYPENTWRMFNNDRTGGEGSSESTRVVTRTTTSGYVCTKAAILRSVGDTLMRGLIIFPDTYTHPYNFKEIVYHGRADKKITENSPHYGCKNAHWRDNGITLKEWDILEKVGGCVFLPVTALRERYKDANNNRIVSTSRYFGEAAYWTGYGTTTTEKKTIDGVQQTVPTATNINAACFIASDLYYCSMTKADGATNINPGKSVARTYGAAVRLIRDVN